MKLFKDALYNYVRLNDCEREVADSRVFQRLRYIKQLAMAYLVYPGANHTRFEHSLGVLFLAKRYFELRGEEPDDELVLAALLHDVGHGPFSHESEHLFKRGGIISHEDLSVKKVGSGEIADIIERHGFSPRKVCGYIKGRGKGVLITGALGIDRMDYLMRDSYYAGTLHGKIDYERLMNNIEIRGGRLMLDAKGIEEAESLVLSRFMMFATLYQHKTVDIARAMVRKAMEHAYDDGVFTLDEFSNMTDYECMMRAGESKSAAPIIERVLGRGLYKTAVFMRGYEIPEKFREAIANESFIRKFERELCAECGLTQDEVVTHYTTGNYKAIDVHISGDKMRELAEVSDVVASIKEAYERKRVFFVAVPEEKRVKVGKVAVNIIKSYS